MNISRNGVPTVYGFVFMLLGLFIAMPVQIACARQSDQQVIGPNAVWSPPDGKWEEIHEYCARGGKTKSSCIAAGMQRAGASLEAVAFAKSMNGEFYLSTFKNMGVVDLAEMTGPLQNDPETTQSILVNGNPRIVKLWDHIENFNIKKDANYQTIARKFPKAELWMMHRFDALEKLPQGVQRFIFSFVLLNGCRACEVAGSAIFAFDFDSQGKYQGSRLLRLTREKIL